MSHTVDTLLEAVAKTERLTLDDVSEEVYHAIPAMSASGLKEFRKGPGFYKWSRENPSEDTTARLEGRLVHMAIGEPKRFNDSVVMVEGHRGSKDVKAEIARWEAEGKIVVKPDQFKMASETAAYCRSHPLVSEILKNGKSEVTMLWRTTVSNERSVLCKARVDWLTSNGVLVDWKTFDQTYNDDLLEYQVRSMGYQFQAEWYLRAYETVYRKKPKAFYSVFIRNQEPYDVAVREISLETRQLAVPEIERVLERYANCLAEDTWPMTAPEVGEITVKTFK